MMLLHIFDDPDFNKPTDVSFDQFVAEDYTYLNKEGEEKVGKRTIRKKITKTFDTFKGEFDGNAKLYLLHRYEILNDNFCWPQILAESSLGYIFHQDYS